MPAEEPRAREPPFSSSPCRGDSVSPTLSTPRVAQGGAVVPVGRDGRQLRRDVRRHERSRLPARRASRETSSCRVRRRRPASGRTFRATSAARSAVVFPVSGSKLNVFRRVPSAPWTVPLDARRASPSPSGRSGTPSSETGQETASPVSASRSMASFAFQRLPALVNRRLRQDGVMPPNLSRIWALSRAMAQERESVACRWIREAGPGFRRPARTTGFPASGTTNGRTRPDRTMRVFDVASVDR